MNHCVLHFNKKTSWVGKKKEVMKTSATVGIKCHDFKEIYVNWLFWYKIVVSYNPATTICYLYPEEVAINYYSDEVHCAMKK